jgi:hypothetical protein
MDDVGSASKVWCGRKLWPPAYRELEATEIATLGNILYGFCAKLTVGVTACWVEADGSYTPFYERFPAQASEWKRLSDEGLVEIANHGYTHCVLGKHRPRWFRSNRKYWREFQPWVYDKVRSECLFNAQNNLTQWLEIPIRTFIPPGNVFTQNEVQTAENWCITHICTDRFPANAKVGDMTFVGSESMFAFHDKDIVLNGPGWLEKHIKRLKRKDRQFVFAKEICV